MPCKTTPIIAYLTYYNQLISLSHILMGGCGRVCLDVVGTLQEQQIGIYELN